jgi:chorismate mutase
MAMKIELEHRLRELTAEIRHYPTPIARCDEQLTGLLEERARLIAALKQNEENGDCSPVAIWINDGGFHAAQSL